jgi:hypothetical protein
MDTASPTNVQTTATGPTSQQFLQEITKADDVINSVTMPQLAYNLNSSNDTPQHTPNTHHCETTNNKSTNQHVDQTSSHQEKASTSQNNNRKSTPYSIKPEHGTPSKCHTPTRRNSTENIGSPTTTKATPNCKPSTKSLATTQDHGMSTDHKALKPVHPINATIVTTTQAHSQDVPMKDVLQIIPNTTTDILTSLNYYQPPIKPKVLTNPYAKTSKIKTIVPNAKHLRAETFCNEKKKPTRANTNQRSITNAEPPEIQEPPSLQKQNNTPSAFHFDLQGTLSQDSKMFTIY